MENLSPKLLLKYLQANPVIPCTSQFAEISQGQFSRIKVILMYDLDIITLFKIAKKNQEIQKEIILNVDMIEGISCDKNGLGFLKQYLNIKAIASSSPKVINYAKKLGFIIVQTLFMFDTKSLEKGIELIQQSKPHFIDIRPGISYLLIEKTLSGRIGNIPVICSGLIQNETDIKNILSKNATAVTTSNQALWGLYL
ncbi:MAG: glycerol-3-phosphate responsive antiterminator [Actinomycetota bacterium]|nr:glycerol-3-phosphate responsive antiterminator [Actinomycetota bacterium]